MTYPGGKSGAGVYQTLINLMPPHEVYIEPFLGAGAIMRLKRPAALNIGIDLDPTARKLAMPPGHNSRSTESLELANGAARALSVDLGRKQISAATAGNGAEYSPAGNGAAARRRSQLPAMVDPRSLIARNGEAASRYEFVEGDGIQFLADYPFAGRELVYCDPPYLMSTRSGKRLYEFELSDVDHRRLLRVIRNLRCRVMISGYSSAIYAKELKGWNATSFQTTTRGGKPVAEWVWYNFDRPVELHDYRFLGDNFREREKLKRQKARWIARLERMPILQRQMLLSAINTPGS